MSTFSFSGLAGADGALSRAELTAGLTRMSGADGSFSRSEFVATFGNLDVSEETAGSIFDNLAEGDALGVEALADTWLASAGADGELSEGEFDAGVEALVTDAEGDISFSDAAGADGSMSRGEFEAIAEDAGITDEGAVDELFDRLAGGDGELSESEFANEENGFGATTLSREAFRERFEALTSGGTIDFAADAGADGAMSRDEFGSVAERAGITDEDAIDEVFESLAGADGELSEGEFSNAENGFGATELSTEDFATRFGELSGDDPFSFGDAAGEDGILSLEEFTSSLNDLGIEGLSESSIENFFMRFAGADNEMSEAEASELEGKSATELEEMIRG